jgi:hypothetical protein
MKDKSRNVVIPKLLGIKDLKDYEHLLIPYEKAIDAMVLTMEKILKEMDGQ